MKKGYINGSDLLIKINGAAAGHSTTHTTSYSSETKERAVKPPFENKITAGLWKEKGVVGLSISISFEGLRHYEEMECGFAELLAAWKSGQPVEVECYERESAKPYLKGMFVIASLEETGAAQDDAGYSGSLENSGEPEVLDESALTTGAAASGKSTTGAKS